MIRWSWSGTIPSSSRGRFPFSRRRAWFFCYTGTRNTDLEELVNAGSLCRTRPSSGSISSPRASQYWEPCRTDRSGECRWTLFTLDSLATLLNNLSLHASAGDIRSRHLEGNSHMSPSWTFAINIAARARLYFYSPGLGTISIACPTSHPSVCHLFEPITRSYRAYCFMSPTNCPNRSYSFNSL